MPPEAIFKQFVRPIGIGAIAMAGIIGVIKSGGVIGSAFKLAAGIGGKAGGHGEVVRTQRDLKMSFVALFIGLTLVAVFVFFLFGVKITLTQAIVALVVVTVISFLFTTVAANAIAIVGTNPISGVVCTALSMAGGFITDLKIGYWLGTTPAKQQTFKFLGTIVAAATVGGVIFILNKVFGFVQTPTHANPMVAPQANAMAAVIEPLMSGNGAPWILLAVGAVISVIMNWLKISPLAFALGMFIPLQLNTPLAVGGLLSYFINKNKDEKLAKARNARGILIASGFIAGAALFGVAGALLALLVGDVDKLAILDWSKIAHGEGLSQGLAIVMFALLLVYFVWETRRAKIDD